MSQPLLRVLHHLKSSPILVYGDLILDRYTFGTAERVSPEAPVLVLQTDRRDARLGGAGSVCQMLRSLGSKTSVAGVVGADDAAAEVRRLFVESDIDQTLVVGDPTRETTVKERLMGICGHGAPRQMMRVDSESTHAIDGTLAKKLSADCTAHLDRVRAVLISDYGKGVCTPVAVQRLIAAARDRGIPVAVDPAITADYANYAGATVVTPNRREAECSSGMRITTPRDATRAANILQQRFQLEAVAITLDSDGIVLVSADGREQLFAARAREVCDVTGAGDMVLATVGACLASGIALPEAVGLANIAAGIAVEKIGTAPVSREEISVALQCGSAGHGKLVTWEQMVSEADRMRDEGRTLVLTNGCFDLLHSGHVNCLREAAGFGDRLVVAINSDQSVRRLKGAGRPVVDETARATVLAALEFVDYVLIFDESTPHALLRAVRPDVLVKGGTYATEEVVGGEIVESYGGHVRVTGATEDVSTTRIIQSIVES